MANTTLTTFKSHISKIPLSSYNNTPSDKECPVPLDQQPINEYQSLSTSFPFSWASGDIVEYCSRLFVMGSSFALFVGLPVSLFGSVGLKAEPIRIFSGSVSSGLFVVILAVVRMYLGWAYVGNRLLSATVEYEETGWYDGQVKPVLGRLKNTLVVLGISLLMCISVFVKSESSSKYNYAPQEPGGRAVPGVYNDESARNFEPDAFCGEPISPD